MSYSGLTKHPTIPNAYTNATQGLQNYGANLRKNFDAQQAAFNSRANNKGYYKSANPFPNPFKMSSYQ